MCADNSAVHKWRGTAKGQRAGCGADRVILMGIYCMVIIYERGGSFLVNICLSIVVARKNLSSMMMMMHVLYSAGGAAHIYK